ncbi:MAG TPA: hypothetical protein DIW81_17995 [Planctomycetaceae bacterium]|nr:hypothetical protein [Rubinisphaera sp.]HCS53456.1 hypothetical protein [Planctomycetaceae bacterium]
MLVRGWPDRLGQIAKQKEIAAIRLKLQSLIGSQNPPHKDGIFFDFIAPTESTSTGNLFEKCSFKFN